jgi:transcriptional regulator with XRE-family HTH domain
MHPVNGFYQEFGRRVRAARDDAGLSQEELASRVGLSRGSIANIERGAQRVALHTFVEIAAALGVDSVRLIPQTLGRTARLVRALREAGESDAIVAWGERAVGRISDDEVDEIKADDA